MIDRYRLIPAILASMTLAATAAFAHHSKSSIDLNAPVEFRGTITNFRWRAPHVYLEIDSIQDDGSVVGYTVETLNPTALARVGWRKEDFQPGDKVIWAGHHAKDPDRNYAALEWIEKIGAQRRFITMLALKPYLQENGISLNEYLGLEKPQPATRIGEGTWARVGKPGGPFEPIRSPRKGWPYTELAAAEVANFSEDQNPLRNCISPGFPKRMFEPVNVQFSWIDDKTIMVDQDLQPEPRYIHLDPGVEPGPPSPQGHSVGHFEDDQLVVETTNFVADAWGTFAGVSSSDQKHVVERYWLSKEGMQLNVEFTITDPVYLAEPVVVTHQWGKIAARPIVKAECSLENAQYHLTAGYEDE